MPTPRRALPPQDGEDSGREAREPGSASDAASPGGRGHEGWTSRDHEPTVPLNWHQNVDEFGDPRTSEPLLPTRGRSAPPRPVLPTRTPSSGPSAQMSAGRRFSDDSLPVGFVSAIARRSASSPSQWDDWDDNEWDEGERELLQDWRNRRDQGRSGVTQSRRPGDRYEEPYEPDSAATAQLRYGLDSRPGDSYARPGADDPYSQPSASRRAAPDPYGQPSASRAYRESSSQPPAERPRPYGAASAPRSAQSPAPYGSRPPSPYGRPEGRREDTPRGAEPLARTSHREPRPVGDDAGEPAEPRRQRWWVWAVAAVLLLALATVAIVLGPRLLRTEVPGAVPSGDPELLLTKDEAAEVSKNEWTVESTEPVINPNSPSARCLGGNDPQGMPGARSAAQRRLVNKTDNLTLLNRVDTYSDEQTAHTAYLKRVSQLGACEGGGSPLYLQGGVALPNLANESTMVRVQAQEAIVEYHSVVLTRLGLGVVVVDLGRSGDEPDRTALMNMMRKIVQRDAEKLKGESNIGVVPADAPPPAGPLQGLLGVADVPRVTNGIGTWIATTEHSVKTGGTMCEGIDMKAPPGATSQSQRTLVLQGDASAAGTFGVDEVVYVFPSAEDASKTAANLVQSIATCGERRPASIGRQSTFPGKGSNGEDFTGTVFTIQQQGTNQTLSYRVAVMSIGTKLIYVLLTPTQQYNLTEEAWAAVARRAGERATQAS